MVLEVDEKTEQPTERRRREAREAGLGPRSADLAVACRLVGLASALQFFGPGLMWELSQILTQSFQPLIPTEISSEILVSRIWEAVYRVSASCLGIWACLWTGSLVAHFMQVGFRFQPANLLPDFSRLNPWSGLSKLWRFEQAAQVSWGLLKYSLLVSCGAWSLWYQLGALAALTDAELPTVAAAVGQSLVTVAWQLAGIALIFGLTDYGVQFCRFEQSLKMTTAELREEQRHSAPNPQWKQQRRDLWQRQLTAAAVSSEPVTRVGGSTAMHTQPARPT